MNVINKLKDVVIITLLSLVLLCIFVPIVASATSVSYTKVNRTFKSSYSKSTTYDKNDYEMTMTCKLESTNKITTKASTSSGDYKEVYALEWNKNGTLKSNNKSSNNESVSTTANPSLFTPTHTAHYAYTKTGNYEVDVYYK